MNSRTSRPRSPTRQMTLISADVDLAMTRGVNYPRGPLAWGNELGLLHVVEEIERLREDSGEERYRSSPLLRTMVKEGKKFFE